MDFNVKKTKMITFLLCAAVVFSCSGCGDPVVSSGEEPDRREVGRYVEEAVDYGSQDENMVSLVQEDERLRLIGLYGEDMISDDSGSSFEKAEAVPAAYRDEDMAGTISLAGAPDGSRILMEYTDGEGAWSLITADGREIALEGLGKEGYPSFYQGAGCFYMSSGYEIYRIDPKTGEMEFLTESASYPLYLAAGGDMLFVIHTGGVLLYDLQKDRAAERQDEVLSSFFAGKQDDFLSGAASALLYPQGEDIYVLTHSGIFFHELYGDEMECVVDGGACGIGDIGRGFAGMAVTEGNGESAGSSEEKAFTILYTDGNLMRYVKDNNLPAEPETMFRIYSLYEDGNIRQAVSAFRKKYPELYIKYEVGVNPDYGATREDALRNLSTELAAGTGPDILVMDDIPFETYAEKGVLEELGFLREGMSDEEYYATVIDGFATETGLYVIPLTFAVPVLAGDAGKIAEAGELMTLSQLADLLEKTAAGQSGTTAGQSEQGGIAAGQSEQGGTAAGQSGQDGTTSGQNGQGETTSGPMESVIGFLSAEEALRLFAQSSMESWRKEDGTLDRDAVTEFLTQVKRIYDIQMKNLPDELQYMSFSGMEWGSGENTLARRNGSYGLAEALSTRIMRFPGQPFCAGYLSSATEDFVMTQGKLDYMESGYVSLPGQNFGECLPATLMAMNSKTLREEESRLFMEFIFSVEFQGAASLNGTPVNRSACLQRQKNPDEGSTEPYAAMGYGMADGSQNILQIYWPSEEDFARLDSLLESVSGVNYCDVRIYEAVTELGQAALTGDAGIEETVDEIEKALELYLAE